MNPKNFLILLNNCPTPAEKCGNFRTFANDMAFILSYKH